MYLRGTNYLQKKFLQINSLICKIKFYKNIKNKLKFLISKNFNKIFPYLQKLDLQFSSIFYQQKKFFRKKRYFIKPNFFTSISCRTLILKIFLLCGAMLGKYIFSVTINNTECSASLQINSANFWKV